MHPTLTSCIAAISQARSIPHSQQATRAYVAAQMSGIFDDQELIDAMLAEINLNKSRMALITDLIKPAVAAGLMGRAASKEAEPFPESLNVNFAVIWSRLVRGLSMPGAQRAGERADSPSSDEMVQAICLTLANAILSDSKTPADRLAFKLGEWLRTGTVPPLPGAPGDQQNAFLNYFDGTTCLLGLDAWQPILYSPDPKDASKPCPVRQDREDLLMQTRLRFPTGRLIIEGQCTLDAYLEAEAHIREEQRLSLNYALHRTCLSAKMASDLDAAYISCDDETLGVYRHPDGTMLIIGQGLDLPQIGTISAASQSVNVIDQATLSRIAGDEALVESYLETGRRPLEAEVRPGSWCLYWGSSFSGSHLASVARKHGIASGSKISLILSKTPLDFGETSVFDV